MTPSGRSSARAGTAGRTDITLRRHHPTELPGYLPNGEQLDAHRVRFVGRDMLEASALFGFVRPLAAMSPFGSCTKSRTLLAGASAFRKVPSKRATPPSG